MSFLKIVFFFSVIASSLSLGAIFFIAQQPWVNFAILEYYNPGKPSIVYDETGAEWTRFQLDRRDIITIDAMPEKLIKAFLAAEDWDFFNHRGISFKGIIRSLLVNIYNRKKVQGASTITQQLTKLLFFDAQKSYSRKIKEQLISLIIERQFTKEHILETYLNHVCFGSAIYGVEAASQRFWNKHVSEITINEAAVLAGIVRCPQRYCPLYNTDNTQQRRNIVLNSMYKLKFISKDEYEYSKKQPVVIAKNERITLAPHLRETLRLFLENLVGKQKLYSGGLKIQTTLNIKMQEAAEASFKTHISNLKLAIAQDIDGSLIAIDGSTGAIKSLIGGYDFKQSQFNRAFKAKRQMGSTIKPLIYAAALQEGFNLTDTALDEPLTIIDNNKEWTPHNFNHKFTGSLTLAYALSLSNNIIAIKTLLACGAEKVINIAQKCGIQGPLYPYPSLALGCVDGTIEEAAAMMNVFAHNGMYSKPYFITWIKDEWGTKIWKHTQTSKQVLSSSISGQVGKALTLSINRLKKHFPDNWLATEALGKTGTTNDARTCWFTGATPSLTTSVYVGCDDNRSLGNKVYAVKTAFPLWLDFNKTVGAQEKDFVFDSSLHETTVDQRSGSKTNRENPYSITLLVPN